MFRVVFVCTGNTCRSPMAEYLLKQVLSQRGLQDRVEVRSAGLAAFPGDSINGQALDVLADLYEINAAEHRSSRISVPLLNEQDLILAMTVAHADQLRRLMPELSDRIFTLIEFYLEKQKVDPAVVWQTYTSLDVADPYGQSRDVYEESAANIREYILLVADYIEEELRD